MLARRQLLRLHFAPRLRRLRPLQRPIHDVIFQLVVRHVDLAVAHAAAHGHTGDVHGLRIAGHQRVPPVEVAAFVDEAVGTGRRQPGGFGDIVRGELHAVVHEAGAIPVILAAAGALVEQPAGHGGVEGAVGAVLLELVQAAAAAAVAQALPFRRGHFVQALAAPEGGVVAVHCRTVAIHCRTMAGEEFVRRLRKQGLAHDTPSPAISLQFGALSRCSFFVNFLGLYSSGRRKPAMAINGRRNKPIGPGGSTRRLHQRGRTRIDEGVKGALLPGMVPTLLGQTHSCQRQLCSGCSGCVSGLKYRTEVPAF